MLVDGVFGWHYSTVGRGVAVRAAPARSVNERASVRASVERRTNSNDGAGPEATGPSELEGDFSAHLLRWSLRWLRHLVSRHTWRLRHTSLSKDTFRRSLETYFFALY